MRKKSLIRNETLHCFFNLSVFSKTWLQGEFIRENVRINALVDTETLIILLFVCGFRVIKCQSFRRSSSRIHRLDLNTSVSSSFYVVGDRSYYRVLFICSLTRLEARDGFYA